MVRQQTPTCGWLAASGCRYWGRVRQKHQGRLVRWSSAPHEYSAWQMSQKQSCEVSQEQSSEATAKTKKM